MLGKIFTKMILLIIFSVLCISILIPPSEAHILIIGDSKSDYPVALQETQALASELKSRGYNVLELYQDQANTKNILKGMYDADAIIYAGHGGYQSGNYNSGGIAKDPFALVGSNDFIWGIGSQMREGWNGELFYAPFKSNIPVILLHACFSTGWVENNEVSNPIETIYDFSNMFTSAGANYYATAWNGAEIVYDFLNGASTFQDANQINYEKITKETIYNGVPIWKNDHGYAAFVGNWLGQFPTASQTTLYNDAEAESWYNGNRVKNEVRPDLHIQSLTTHGNAATGYGYTIDSLIYNSGAKVSDNFYLRYYLDPDTTWNGNEIVIGSKLISGIDGWAPKSDSSTFTIPTNIAEKSYNVVAYADVTGVVPEIHETDNYKRSGWIYVWGPDLITSSVIPPGNAIAGNPASFPYNVVFNVANNRYGDAGPFYVSAYVSKDNVKSNDDRYIGYKYFPSGLGRMSSTGTQVMDCYLPKDVAQGNYHIILVADSTITVPELNNVNNAKASSSKIFIWRPDLRIDSVLGYGPTTRGSTSFHASSIVHNYGSYAQNFYVSYYLSADPYKSSNDRYIGYNTVNSLNGWTSTTLDNTDCKIPSDIAPGWYYMIAVADVTGTSPESNEANNVRASASRVQVV